MIVDSKDHSNKQRVVLITFLDGGDFTLQVNGEFKNVESGVTYSCNSDTNSDFSVMEFMRMACKASFVRFLQFKEGNFLKFLSLLFLLSSLCLKVFFTCNIFLIFSVLVF